MIGSKECMIVYGENGTEKIAVDMGKRKERVLSTEEIQRLVTEGMNIERHYGHPMDVE